MAAPVSGSVDLGGWVGIITGGARGIGEAIALAVAKEGASIAILDVLDSTEVEDRVRSCGVDCVSFKCDIRDEDSVKRSISGILARYGKVDFLVSNAAILGRSRGELYEYTVEEFVEVLSVNLVGTFLVTKHVWPIMVKQKWGKIVCIGSIAGRIGGLLAGPHYTSSKGAIHAFVKWAAKRGAPYGIYVNGIAPGPVATPMIAAEPYDAKMVPLGRLGVPEDIAQAALFFVSQASNFITGVVLDVNGGIYM